MVDERVVSITEKSGHKAFQVSFAAQGVLFAIIGTTVVDLPLSTALGGLFALSGLAYIGAYNWYRRSM